MRDRSETSEKKTTNTKRTRSTGTRKTFRADLSIPWILRLPCTPCIHKKVRHVAFLSRFPYSLGLNLSPFLFEATQFVSSWTAEDREAAAHECSDQCSKSAPGE